MLRIPAARIRSLMLALSVCSLPQSARPAVSFSIAPNVISNTYSGAVTLSVTGLTNGESVSIRKYLDLNKNGIVDAGEPLVNAFKLTDGGAYLIGGVTDINVPFDHNVAAGAITTTLSIAPPRSLENLVGQAIFQATSPVQNFSPISATLTITNAALDQSVSGVIRSDGGTPVPYAVVAILQMSPGNDGGGRWAAGAIADDTGYFHVNLNSSAYVLIPAYPGYFTDQSLGWQVTLTNGMSVTNDLFMTNSTATISGNVHDAATSKGLGGVMVSVEADSYFGIAFTDTNGNYTLGAAPAPSRVGVDSDQVSQRAYLVAQDKIQVDTSTGSVANVDFALPRATAMFYGTFTNTAGAPMANVGFSAQDNSNLYDTHGITDNGGNFCVAVLGGASQWYCGPDSSDPALAGYLVSRFDSTNLSVGQALAFPMTALPATAQISGHVQDSLGNPVASIGMIGSATINGVQYSTYVDTDSSGDYSLGAGPGLWSVFVNCCGDRGLENFGLTDLSQHFVSIPPTNAVLNFTLYPYGTPALSPPGRIGSTFGFGLIGAPGTNYTILVSTNLGSGNWSTLLVTNLIGNFAFIQDDQATNKQRFYRALRGP